MYSFQEKLIMLLNSGKKNLKYYFFNILINFKIVKHNIIICSHINFMFYNFIRYPFCLNKIEKDEKD